VSEFENRLTFDQLMKKTCGLSYWTTL